MKRSLILKTLIASSLLTGAITFAVGTTKNNKIESANAASSLTNGGYDDGEYKYYDGTYYDSIGDEAIAAKGTTLLSALNSLIEPSNAFGYDNIWTFNETYDCYPSNYNGTDPLTGNVYPTTDNTAKRGKMWDMYSDKTWTGTSQRAGNVQSYVGGTYNREHSMPKSWFGGSYSNQPGTDPNHLFNTDGKVNGIRSNYAYGEVTGEVKNNCYTMTSGCVGFGKLGTNSNGKTVFEPDDAYKGDLARAQMYMATAYYGWNLTQESNGATDCFTYSSGHSTMKAYYINLLTKWSENDPVSQKEIDRNNAVYSQQGNRNPFIDHPSWANKIWGGTDYTWGKNDDTPKVNSVTVSPSEASLTIGGTTTKQLSVTVNVSNGAAQTVSWTSSNTNVATVSNSGLVTAVAAGSATITATSTVDGTKSGTCAVTVTDPTQPSITFDKEQASVTVGSTVTITATTQNGSGNVTWTTSNANIATVNNGVVTGVAAGSATITGTYSGKTATCAITVTASGGGSSDISGNYTLYSGTITEGNYVIVYDGTAVQNTINSNRLTYSSVTISNSKISNPSASVVWYIEPSSTYWTLYNNAVGKYAGSTNAKNQAALLDSVTNNAKWTVTGSSTYEFENLARSTGTDSGNKYLRKNGTYGFACYASGTGGALTLYKQEASAAPTLSTIAVKTAPTKTTYTAGEYFNPAGLVITRTYSDSSTSDYTYANHTSEFSFNPSTSTALKTTDVSVTITYGGKDCSQAITVNPAPATSITASVDKTFYVGETITKSDITVTDNNENNVADFTFTSYQFTYADAASGGALTNKTFTNGVTFGNLKCDLTVQVQRKARINPTTVKDTITASDLAATSTGYTTFSGVSKTSSAVYAGKTALNNSENIQIKSNNSDTGIVSTTSGGTIQSVTITVASGSNTILVFGKNSAYTAATDLYDNNKKGTQVGTTSSTATINFTTAYSYVGIRSSSGACYISSIEITYGTSDSAINLANYIMYEDTNNQCTSKFTIAKGYFEGLTSSERETFMTSTDYVVETARTRLDAWAKNQGKTISYTNNDYAISSAKSVLLAINNNSLLSFGLVLMTIGGLIYAGTFIFKKKEK